MSRSSISWSANRQCLWPTDFWLAASRRLSHIHESMMGHRGAMMVNSVLPVVFTLTAISCTGDEPAKPQPDEAQVRAVAEAIIAADNARDLERVLGLYTEDAVLFPPNDAAIKGKLAIRPRYEKLFREMQPELAGAI